MALREPWLPSDMDTAREQFEPAVLEMADVAVAALHSPESVVLDNVQWIVRRGEYWVIGGPPGSGKSDLFTTAAGLMRPCRGTHRLFGQDTGHLREEERVRIQLRVGLVFGNGGRLFSHLTVTENLALPLGYHRTLPQGESEERVRMVLDLMELTHVAHQMPALIDRNLQQRAALARALVLSPDLILMDNPLGGTGPRELRWWLSFLEALRRGHAILEGRPPTLVIGTSDLEDWAEHGHQFALTHDRRFVPLGGRADLVKQSDPALRELLRSDWLKD